MRLTRKLAEFAHWLECHWWSALFRKDLIKIGLIIIIRIKIKVIKLIIKEAAQSSLSYLNYSEFKAFIAEFIIIKPTNHFQIE